jgi:DNA-binding winged helix-turn-helix (wHTH) protein
VQVPAGEMRTVRFGTFEVNLTTGELRKQGVRLKLQDQPFQVLTMLLARPGQLVTRDEIRQKLWPSGTFVDFDNGLNAAINRLREALGDSAENSRFIETHPRRGYRWITPVELTHSLPTNLPAVVPIDTSEGPRETFKNLGFSPLRQLALGQTFFFLLAAYEVLHLGKRMEWAPQLFGRTPARYQLFYYCNLAVFVTGFVVTGLSALEIWRGSLQAVQSFRRLFVVYLLPDVFLFQVVLSLFFEYNIVGYILVLLPVPVLLPFYQKQLAQ